jgi:NAD(P)-dependent dehydrogenase (short-subunit alcohol dehydrogenase family)
MAARFGIAGIALNGSSKAAPGPAHPVLGGGVRPEWRPKRIAAAITYLASEDASFVHGAILDADGGANAT